MTLKKAIRTYHDVLTDELAAESQGQLTEQMGRRLDSANFCCRKEVDNFMTRNANPV
jgi:hypothetical protein